MPGRRPAFRSNPVTGSVIPHSHHSRTVSPGSGFRVERDLLHRLPAFAGGDQAGHALRPGDDDRPGVAVAGGQHFDEASVVRHVKGDRLSLVLLLQHRQDGLLRPEEHTSELQSLMRTSYAVFSWKKNRSRHTLVIP